MKNSLILLLIFITNMLVAQESASSFTGTNGERKRDPRMDQLSYVPNEIIVKFKDETAISTASRIKAAGISSVDAVLKKYEIVVLERIFPEAKKPARARSVRSPQGKELKVPSLDKIYRMTVPEADATLARPASIHVVIDELKKLPEVEYAEPNYIYSIDELQPVGSELSASELAGMKVGKQSTSPSAVVPNDPLFEQQEYLRMVQADLAWAQTTGDTTQVIAILDTGVDWTHPDLKNKIWRNWDEIPDNGIDDDGNGYIDDVRGWDYINNDNNPMDDNSHGTHVAGIAAAETNNGIGTAGINWNAKIMPLKVFQSSGRGDAMTISRGIIYASEKGATVINMSFGSYARSYAVEDALVNAYSKCVLVASAGNDNIYIGPKVDCKRQNGYPFFPAAFSFVLGVSDGSNCGLGYANYDDDPIYSDYYELFNYELVAPGSAILSLVPGGNYRRYTGTSMSAPIASGIAALYRSYKKDVSQELLWADLIHTSKGVISSFDAINSVPVPKLMLVNYNLVDTLLDNFHDGRVIAGKEIDIEVMIKNTWGMCDSVIVELDFDEFEDRTVATILNGTVNFGKASTYSMLKNTSNPFKVRISQDVAHDRDIQFVLSIYYPNSPDTIRSPLKLTISNGAELSGILLKDTILTPDRFWLIRKSLRIAQGVNVTVLPGVKLEVVRNTVDNRGFFKAIGTKDSLILMKGVISGQAQYKYVDMNLNGTALKTEFPVENCIIKNNSYGVMSDGSTYFDFVFADNCVFEDMSASFIAFLGAFRQGVVVRNSIFRNSTITNLIRSLPASVEKCLFYNINVPPPANYTEHYWIENYSTIKYTVFDRLYRDFWANKGRTILHNSSVNSFGNSYLSSDDYVYFVAASGGEDMLVYDNNYWGSDMTNLIRRKYIDFVNNPQLPYLMLEPRLTAPSDSAHAHVWKVLVNGKDTQDENVDPIGVGRHRFDVYFNREMSPEYTPKVSFGVRYPYVQQLVNEDGVWSEDGKIYTVYKTIKLTTGDGINKIRVAGAKEINGWDFEIPVEDSRFSFIIAAASSASTEFMATPGLGKVNLEWNHNDLEDGLGYNMYRMEHINDSTLTQPVIVNSSLITDTLYTDYSVVPNKKYYYYYKILRTNMAETDSSRVVSAIPFTASKGDANGDLSVNVLDITTIVAHLLNNNPQPFIREAADVNSDSQINVLDIVGVVNLVLNVPQNAPGIAMNKQVDLYLQNDTLFANSNVDIAAVQLDINGVEKFSDLEVLKALKPFESGNSYSNGSMRVIFYSMSGKSIEPGQSIPLLKLKAESVINDVIIGEPSGASVKVNYIKTRIPDLSTNMNQNMVELGQNYPNPVSEKANTIIPVKIYEPVEKMILRITNLMGQETYVSELYNLKEGRYEFNWNTTNETGVYFYCVEFVFNGKRLVCPAMKMIVN